MAAKEEAGRKAAEIRSSIEGKVNKVMWSPGVLAHGVGGRIFWLALSLQRVQAWAANKPLALLLQSQPALFKVCYALLW